MDGLAVQRFVSVLNLPSCLFKLLPLSHDIRYSDGLSEDNDYWFQFRGTEISRKNPRCCCGTQGKNYPLNPKAGCLCNSCLPPSSEVSIHFLSLQTREEFKSIFNKQIPDNEHIMQAAVQIAAQITNPSHENALPCVLCGQGHNGIDHWLKFCPVPTLTLNALLKQKGWISINFQQIVQCWVIFHLRRYLRELGAFDLNQTRPIRNNTRTHKQSISVTSY